MDSHPLLPGSNVPAESPTLSRMFPGHWLCLPFTAREKQLSVSPAFPDVAADDECRYSGHCTFAYCQEEIDVWTLERTGAFSREAFFGGNGKISLTVVKILQEHLGEFTFLCEVISPRLIFCC